MPNINLMIQLPSGDMKNVSLPNDVSVQELLPELVTTLSVPVTVPTAARSATGSIARRWGVRSKRKRRWRRRRSLMATD
jgi:hypothetical protein